MDKIDKLKFIAVLLNISNDHTGMKILIIILKQSLKYSKIRIKTATLLFVRRLHSKKIVTISKKYFYPKLIKLVKRILDDGISIKRKNKLKIINNISSVFFIPEFIKFYNCRTYFQNL